MCTDCNPQPTLSRRGFFGRVRRQISATPLPEPVEKAPGLEIYPRSAWAGSDREPTGELYPESVYFLEIHHSATANGYSNSEVIGQIQDMYDNDTAPDTGWPDVTYNFFIDRFGRIFEGRAGSLKGPVLNDAVGGNQGWSQQVCLLGTFDDQEPSAEALDSLTRVLSWLADRHELDIGPDATATLESRGSNKIPAGEQFTVNTIAGHRDVGETECPGDAFYPYVVDDLPQVVADYRASLTSPTTTGPTSDSTSPSGTTATTIPGDTSPSTPTSPATSNPTGTTVTGGTNPDGTSPGSLTSTPTTVDGGTPSDPPTTQPVTVGSAGSSTARPLLAGMGSGLGVVAIATGIGWVIQRRRSNGV